MTVQIGTVRGGRQGALWLKRCGAKPAVINVAMLAPEGVFIYQVERNIT